ncbi:nuclear fragile X mental retardation-interacting protein 1-domain-containing protein [Cladochytrium replicatum]|nr:nuclear fragile X mental retardation-interacting protein 1-domain-containing protein [Cladochytrium replicatum]
MHPTYRPPPGRIRTSNEGARPAFRNVQPQYPMMQNPAMPLYGSTLGYQYHQGYNLNVQHQLPALPFVPVPNDPQYAQYALALAPHQPGGFRYSNPPATSRRYQCDNCEKQYSTRNHYEAHLATHVKCTQCDFEATKKFLTLHEEEMHPRINLRVSLESPEEIAQWIEERKRNYPTNENILKKKQKADEAKKDGSGKSDAGSGRKRKNTSKKEQDNDGPSPKVRRRICRYFLQGTCKNGDSCRFSHDESVTSSEVKQTAAAPKRVENGHKRKSLHHLLLASEIQRDKRDLLQIIEFIVRCDFFGDKSNNKESF